eukprot:scaffold1210_cov214-Skeletonema_marinoi.AAC.5
MKFSTAIVALAGVSSTNAALRGVLPANMKELLTDKFAAVEDHDVDCSDNVHPCDNTAECHNDCGSGWMCNPIHESKAGGVEGVKYCRPNVEEDISANVKELLTDKFAAVEDHDVDCSDNVHPCDNTAECHNDCGSGWMCNPIHESKAGGVEGVKYCRPNVEEDISAN